uniref:Uncharacterized protein n=1 Tax=Candidatus Kentrum sp. MB TaxID=2138164 RepID=A0A451BBN1_9GAMM|nr:MAG: hypothetical protein BECKMB1821G_GA0114241_102815 [Candidatus Kentron sp. MB]VFK32040.1 MAG: hypothetical protein BECKMB1821I_GA0114274_102914 [Candidatus Kentron sp. MB]VFK75670.1 MAG: hypothetical protein BECKMB1821H_GA0114242_102834 [Candidatus Kentron sp. MB]
MYFREHVPLHFQAEYQKYEITVEIFEPLKDKAHFRAFTLEGHTLS